MIGLDPEHTTDPDYPVPFLNSGLDPVAPIWCRYVWVQPDGDEPYMDSWPPYGKTVDELEALDDVDDIDALDDVQAAH